MVLRVSIRRTQFSSAVNVFALIYPSEDVGLLVTYQLFPSRGQLVNFVEATRCTCAQAGPGVYLRGRQDQ